MNVDSLADALGSTMSASSLVITIVFALLATLKLVLDFKSRRREDDWRVKLEENENRVAEELNKVEQTDFGTLWAATQQRIGYYHKIATSQARNSFISSQLAIVAGFILLVVFGLIAAQATTAVGAISAGAVGVVGAGLSAYIGATFMKAQSEASAQLREFFNQPVEFARLLGAERLVDSLEDHHRSEAVQNIVKTMMANGSAPPPEKTES